MECAHLDHQAYRNLQHTAVYGLQGTSPAEIQLQLCTVTVCAILESLSRCPYTHSLGHWSAVRGVAQGVPLAPASPADQNANHT